MTTMQTVEGIDLSKEILRMQTREGLEKDMAELAADLYRKFLFLHVKYADVSLTPSKLIDYAWHEHMADSRKYVADCEQLFGSMMHHDPKITGDDMESRYGTTNDLFKKEFGIDLRHVVTGEMARAASCGC